MVKMSDARNFFHFVLERRVVSSIPRPQLLTELRAPTGRLTRHKFTVTGTKRTFVVL
jgi:hypothetical protein